MSRLNQIIDEELPDLIRIRRDLHENPGVMYFEHHASAVVQREMAEAGVAFRAGLAGGTGVVAHLPGTGEKALGLRADMDALPMQEQTGLPHASKVPGVMHACGHDGHTAILIGAARVLARMAKDAPLPQPVTFVFQPAEEGGAGGARMIEDGCLDGSLFAPPVGTMFGLHGWPEFSLGKLATRVGPITAATSVFRVRITGKGCHAAFPHVGTDPIVAAAAVITAVQTIASRNVDPLKSVVVSVTQIHGGTTFNIIPGEVVLEGTIRALDPEVDELAARRFAEIVTHTAAAHGCDAAVEYTMIPYPVTVNSADAIRRLQTVAPETDTGMAPVMGGEDFAFYSHRVPSGFFVVGLNAGPDKMPGLHHPKFDFNDDAIRTGVEVFCRLALEA